MQPSEQKIIACIDGSIFSDAVCDYAAWVAKRIDAPLELLHSINHHQENADKADFSGKIGLGSQEHLLEEMINQDQQTSKQKIQKGKALLQSAKDRLLTHGYDNPACQLKHGDLIESLQELEPEIRAVVLGLKGDVHKDQPDSIGAKLEEIIRTLHKPVLVVNHDFNPPQSLMIAYDGSQAADKAVDMVANRQFYQGMKCHLVCVNKNVENAQQMLEHATSRLNGSASLDVATAQLKGKVEVELCNYQEEHSIDLIVMGAFSHHLLHEILLGSFTHKMLVKSQIPLLLLR